MDKQLSPYEIIPPTELNTYQELFSFFDKEDTGYIPIANVPTFIRGIGHCPTQNQISKILEGFGAPNKKQISFHELIEFLAKTPKEQMVQEKLIDSFNVLNSNSEGRSELMPINFLKKLLSQAGQPLSEQEQKQLTDFLNTKDLKVGEQQFNYKNFCRILAYADIQA